MEIRVNNALLNIHVATHISNKSNQINNIT